jgi:hypothetical protein
VRERLYVGIMLPFDLLLVLDQPLSCLKRELFLFCRLFPLMAYGQVAKLHRSSTRDRRWLQCLWSGFALSAESEASLPISFRRRSPPNSIRGHSLILWTRKKYLETLAMRPKGTRVDILKFACEDSISRNVLQAVLCQISEGSRSRPTSLWALSL